MKKRMIEIMDKFQQYNSDNMAYLAFVLDKNEHYDGVYKGLAEVGTDGEYCGGLINLKLR